MARGDLVGDAYVRIHANTVGMQRAIERDMARAGVEGGETYLDAFDRYVQEHSDAKLRSVYSSLARAVATGDWDSAFRQAGVSLDQFADVTKAKLTEIDTHLRTLNGPGGGMADFAARLEELDDWVERTRIAEQFKEVEAEVRRVNRELRDTGRVFTADNLNEGLALLSERARQANLELQRSQLYLRRYSNDLDRTTIIMNRHSDRIGRMFGAQSRSEVLNFFGRVVGWTARIPGMITGALARITGGMSDVVDRFRELRGMNPGVLGLARSLSGALGPAISALMPSLVSVVGGIAVLSQVIPGLIMVITLLAGSILAVVGAITVGLLGALAAITPLAMAAIGGLGALILGITQLGDASDGTKKRLVPLTRAWQEFKNVIVDDVIKVILTNVEGLSTLLSTRFTPLIRAFIAEIGGIATGFFSLFNSKRMKPFLDAMQTSLPKIFRSLGDAFVKFGAGFTALLKPILPYAERLADKIEAAADKFLTWVTSAEGQNAVADWMRDAWDAASQLWTVLKNTWSVLSTILGAGAPTGETFLSWLGRSLETFNKWLNEPVTPLDETLEDKIMKGRASAPQTRIQKFFDDVKGFMTDALGIIKEVKAALEEVDWDQTIEDIKSIMTAITGFIGAVAYVFTSVASAVTTARTTLSEEVENIKALFDTSDWPDSWGEFWDRLITGAREKLAPFFYETLPGWVNDGWNALFGDGGAFARLRESIVGWWDREVYPGIADWGRNLHKALIQPWEDGWNALFGAGGTFPRLRQAFADFFQVTLPGIVASVANIFIMWYNMSLGPVFGFIVDAIATLMDRFGEMLLTLGQVPGFEWATTAGTKMKEAAGRAKGLADNLRYIKPVSVTVTVGTSVASRNVAALQALMSNIRDKTVNIWLRYYELGGTQKTYGPQATASGGVFSGAQVRLIGEAGPEAVVPLNRPLSMVDPSVRELSAYAQGKRMASGGIGGLGQVVIEAGAIVVNSPFANPELVAESVLDRIAARVVV